MLEKLLGMPAEAEGEGAGLVEYRRAISTGAWAAFANLMARQGVPISDESNRVSFTPRWCLCTKAYREAGLIRSSTMLMVRTCEDVVEEG